MAAKNLKASIKVTAGALTNQSHEPLIRELVETAAHRLFGKEAIRHVTKPDTGKTDSQIVFKTGTKIDFLQICSLAAILGTTNIEIYYEQERDLHEDGEEPSELTIWIHGIKVGKR